MSISVRGYTKRLNGRLVTVHGYDATTRNFKDPLVQNANPVSALPTTKRESMGISPPGQHPINHPAAASTAGLTAYQIFPTGQIRWRLSIIPKAGAYKLPDVKHRGRFVK